MVNLIAYWPWLVVGGLFFAFIFVLIGHARASDQAAQGNADSRAAFEVERNALKEITEVWKKDAEAYKRSMEALEDALCDESKELQKAKDFIESLREQNRELEHRCDTAIRGHKAAAPFMREVQDALVCSHLSTDGMPLEQLARLLAWECSVALDPAVSKPAKNLIIKGVRKANKLNRVRLAKVLANHELQCQALANSGRVFEKACNEHFRELQLHREALKNTLQDKIGLPGVRQAFKVAFTRELARLRISTIK